MELALLLLLVASAKSLNMSILDERFVPDPYAVDPNLNQTWVKEVKYWYVPIWSRSEAYFMADFTFERKEVEALDEKALDTVCPYIVLENGTVNHRVFNGKSLVTKGYGSPLRYGRVDRSVVAPNGTESAFWFESRYVLTDNKSYFLTVRLWTCGQMSFLVLSTVPKLPNADIKVIEAKLHELKFKPEHYLDVAYEKHCPNIEADMAKIKTEPFPTASKY